MHHSNSQVTRRRIRRLLTSPFVAVPTLLGGSLAYWCNNGLWNSWDGFALSLLGIGVGTALYRCTLGNKKHADRAREDLRRKARRSENSQLRKIKRSTDQARDPRTGQYVTALSTAFDRLLQVDRWRCEGNDKKGLELAEVHDQAGKLYAECRVLLERSHELWRGATQMATQEIRNRVLASREELFKELQTSLHHLDHALDEVYSSQLSGKSRPIAEATELRDELRRQVEVARQVEERMEDFASDWRLAEPKE